LILIVRRLSTAIWLGGAIALSGHAAADDGRPKLAGYEDLLFGTSEADFRKQVTIVSEHQGPNGSGTLLTTDRIAKVDGSDYVVSAVVIDGVVVRILLNSHSDIDRARCERAFTTMVSFVQEKYGVVGKRIEGGQDSSSMASKFTFRDGGTIVVNAIAASSILCLQSIDVARTDAYDNAMAAARHGNYEEALTILRPLADAGDARSEGALGYFYDKGLGVPLDHKKAAEWYLSAAKQGDAGAQMNVCACYVNGRGVAKDVAEGVRWCIEAAKQNLDVAHFNLGNAYAEGEMGLKQDNLRAYMHYKLAFEHTKDAKLKDWAAQSLEYLRRNMSQPFINKAERMAEAWPDDLP